MVPAPGTLAGIVKSSTGANIAGAKVTATGPTVESTTSGPDGSFSLSLPAGLYTVTATITGYVTGTLTDVSVLAGETQPLTIALSQVSLSSFRTIASVTAGRGGSTINTGAASTSYISAQQFQALANPQINDVLQRTPDVTIQHMGSQADTTVIIGGAQPYETQVLIDGHPLALGQYGVWSSQYFPSFLIGGAEVQTGPGNTTPFANIAVGGTLNLLTPGFTKDFKVDYTEGVDSYSSQSYNLLSSGSYQNLSYVLDYGYASSNGLFTSKSGCSFTPDNYNSGLDNTAGSTGIIQFCGSLGGPLYVKGNLLKLRYDFSHTTSFELGFTGAWSGFDPQGAAWGNSIGSTLVEGCFSGTSPTFVCGNPAYNSLIGQKITGYVFYPGSSVYNNQELFDGQFRTSFGNDTLLIRPYLGAIEPEIIDGSEEGAYASYFGAPPGSPAYTPPTFANGTVIPGSFVPGGAVGTPFEQSCGIHAFNGFTQLQSPTNTSVVVDGQQECYQYPYSADEQDKLYGSTFSYLHPFGTSLLNLTYDFHGQSTFAYFNTPSAVSVPYSSNRYSTFSLTGYLNFVRNLQFNVGLYDTRWTVAGTQAVIGPGGTFVLNAAGSPEQVGLQVGKTRFDPHLALVFRPARSVSYRAAFGTSTTFPFIGQVSGLPSYQPFASSAPQYGGGVDTFKNPRLSPEVSIAYALGADKQLGRNTVLSVDVVQTLIHNVFETILTGETDPSNPAVQLGLATPYNVAHLNSQLLKLKLNYAPPLGLGGNIAVAAERAIIEGIPGSVYSTEVAALPADNQQICGNGQVTPGIPTCLPYLKGYAQGTYAWAAGDFFALGIDYEGKNNSYFQKPFALVDASFRHPVSKNAEINISAENLLNTNVFSGLPEPNAGAPLTADEQTATGGISQTSYLPTLLPVTPRTVHVSLRLHLGD